MSLKVHPNRAWNDRGVPRIGWSPRLRIVVLGICSVFSACEEEGVRAYRAPKQPEKAAAQGARSVTWIPPRGWESVTSDQPTRIATFRPGPGLPEVSVTAFPGDTGGLLANINRWRGQLGLDPINDAQLAETVRSETVEGVGVTTVHITGASGQELLGAVLVPGDGKTWFVKATGDSGAIATITPDFAAFARSFRLQGPAPSLSLNPPPVPTPGAPATVPSGAGQAADVLARLTSWATPPSWRADPNPSSFVSAAFDATNDAGGARITATVLLNDGGGVLNNINRWREQLGLAAVERLDQQPITDLGDGNLVVDLTSADNARRMMAAIVTSQGETWFFKISGTPKGVDAEKAPFDRLVRGVGLGKSTP